MILQVKEYHDNIAQVAEREALEAWRARGYGYPVKSMFYFYREDARGLPTTLRKNGCVEFTENSAKWTMKRPGEV